MEPTKESGISFPILLKSSTSANEHNRETFIERKMDESANDRNDRAIRTSVKWFNAHLSKHMKAKEVAIPWVLLITNDRINKEKADKDGIKAFTTYE